MKTGYRNPKCIRLVTLLDNVREIVLKFRASNEDVNDSLKNFTSVGHKFRHSVNARAYSFHDVARITD